MENTTKRNILRGMALLREQRNLIEALYSIRKDETELMDSNGVIKIDAVLGKFNGAEVLGFIKEKPLFLKEKNAEFPKDKTQKGFLDRCAKVSILLQSCIDAGFLIEVPSHRKEENSVLFYKITDKGTDLLHFLGFWQIASKKYSKSILFLSGIITTIGVQSAAWVVSHWSF